MALVTSKAFWRIAPPSTSEGRAEWRSGEIRLEKIVCSKFPEHQRSGKRLDRLSLNVHGTGDRDFLWTPYSECLVNERVKSLLIDNRFKGYELRPVKLHRQEGEPQLPFWELVVTGWGGAARPESGVKLISECQYCEHRVYSCFTDAGELIDWSQWDGSDIFMVWPLPRYIFVTDRVAQLFRREQLSGYDLQDPMQVRCFGKTLTPGKLSYWMPERRVAEIRLLSDVQM